MQKIDLPIDPHLADIVNLAGLHDNLILTAPPGSGKTTRAPAALLKIFKKIIVLVPRRIAALSSAVRIAEENNFILGEDVGYQVRFENKTNSSTRLIFMTEGVFIKKLSDPNMWNGLELIVFDEFHERSSSIDLCLGICLEKQILGEKIKLMLMSATLNTEKLQQYLSPAHLIEIADKPYPLEIIKSKKAQRLICDHAFADQVIETLQLAEIRAKKDILVFLPGLAEIRFIERQLGTRFKSFEVVIMHGSVRLEEQRHILNPGRGRRVILSTNIAESSITIPSVDCVIDSGLEKKSVSEQKIGFKRLEINRISLFSAKQRAGRAARTGPGTCYQLWHEADERSMPAQILPEIVKSDLLEESLTLLSLGVSHPDQFSWLDKPKKTFKEAFSQLLKWGLLDNELKITEKGLLVQSCPLDIERSLLFVELCFAGFKADASRFLAFLETTNFDKQTEPIELDRLTLTDAGRRVETQLSRISIAVKNKFDGTLTEALIHLFFKIFPNKIAKKKDKNQALSSLGRGVEMASYLVSPAADYFLLLSGRELTNSLTKCDFAIAFSALEFETHSAQNVQLVTEVGFDFEKMKMFKFEKKTAGFFVLSEAVKVYINEKENPDLFGTYFRDHFKELLLLHEHYKNYVTKISFLHKKTVHDFGFSENLDSKILESLAGSVSSMKEFFEMNLFDIILFLTPKDVAADLAQLPDHFTLPRGKVVKVDYESEQAPKISARIQELFGQNTNPTVLNGKLRMTIELLAPNYRPTQITSQLENFWKTSYLEIKKELKARYPKHAWPDDPMEFTGDLYRKKTT